MSKYTLENWLDNVNGEFHIQACRYDNGYYCLGADDYCTDNDTMIDHFWGLVGGDMDWIQAEEYFKTANGCYLAKADDMFTAMTQCIEKVLEYYNE